MHRLILLILLALALTPSPSAARRDHALSLPRHLRSGDIVFQYIPCGELCEAIAETTPCRPGRPFNHCGIVIKAGDSTVVLEAIGKDVHTTSLPAFLARDTAALLYVGRPEKASRAELKEFVRRSLLFAGRPYDNVFLPGDSALYCSELVYEAYRQDEGPLFSLAPMTFKSPRYGATFPAWADYYRKLGRDIPEGLPGINPCSIANSPNIRLLAFPKEKAAGRR